MSVVIPTYNRAALVTRAIHSVLNQTMADLELTVVDDASPDDPTDVIAGIRDPRLRLLKQPENRGQAAALNRGISASRGEWVAFLDDDDEWLPEKIERQLGRAETCGDASVSAIYCRAIVRWPDGVRPPRSRRPFPEGDLLDHLLEGRMPMTPSLFMVRRTALLEVGGFDEMMRASHDLDLWLRMALASHRFAVAPERLAIYDASNSQRKSKDAVAQAVAFRRMDRRWGSLMQERLGADFRQRRVSLRSRTLRRSHKTLVRELVRSGRREDAWRYVRGMLPALPWGTSFVLRASTVGVFGRAPHRLRRAMKRLRRRDATLQDGARSSPDEVPSRKASR